MMIPVFISDLQFPGLFKRSCPCPFPGLGVQIDLRQGQGLDSWLLLRHGSICGIPEAALEKKLYSISLAIDIREV